MKFKFLLFVFLILSSLTNAQIKGKVTNNNGEPLPFVNIYIENSYIGTTSNNEGNYELNISKTDNYTVVFQFLGFKTIKENINAESFPFTLNVSLEEEIVSLNEVVVNAKENPANPIIRKAIENRKKNLSKYDAFKADFYSRGLIKIENAPEKILGQDVGDLGGGLDSTRSGIIYLSETISKIIFKKPDNLKETIIASKVSGDDNGFSFNSASDADFNFYNNTIEIETQLISPISDYAFNYYRYDLEGDYYDDNNNIINKIKVIPKRENDRVFSGYVYIVEDNWSFYAVDLVVTGKQAQIPAADSIKINQSFSYSKSDKLWAKISQSIDFNYSIFGFKGDGRFTAVYSDYDFSPKFTKKSFDNELLSFEEKANKKDSTYWNVIRPVPLSSEEIQDYVKKDSIQIVRKSKKYLDSIDAKNNKFKFGNLFSGYTYKNSYKDWSLGVSAPWFTMAFNTVQGFNGKTTLNFRKNLDEYRRYFDASLTTNYGFSDDRLRINGRLRYKFNNISKPFLTISGGSTTEQFNENLDYLRTFNTSYSLYAEKNYMKIFEKYFAQLDYSQELFNGFRFYSSFSYQKRKALFNNTDQVWFPQDERNYTSNNPLDESAFGVSPFENHNILKLNLTGRIRFGQKYFSYPGSKVAISNNKIPTVYLSYEKGFGSTEDGYNYDRLKARMTQNFDISNKGNFQYNFKAGAFLNADDIAFMDYHHFNGNQLRATMGNYLDSFNNLPYYSFSTKKKYAELHAEHDFKGFILNRIPLINKLNFNLVLGAHALSTENIKPYQEYTIGLNNIGWGKFRFLRVDYLRSYQSGFVSDVFVFGLSF